MSSEVLEINEASETSPTEKEISDSATINVEEPKGDDQSGKELETTVDQGKNEEHEETNIEEQCDVKAVNNVDDASMANMAVGFMEALYGDSSEDEEEDANWEGDEEESDGEEDASEGEAIKEDKEETAADEDEVGEEEAIEKGDQNHATKDKEIAKGDEGEAGEPNAQKVAVGLKKNVKLNGRVKEVAEDIPRKLASGAKPKLSLKKMGKKKVESMGMIFMCSSKTKNDCFQYRILGLPSSKKEMVGKIYPGMRLFLYDVDLKLMYGIFKAVGSGGYNIEPKAFKSKFPSQVRFTVLEDCLPLAEEKFKNVIKENYFTKNKFDCQLNSAQVKTLCKLFSPTSRQQRLQPQRKKLHEPRREEMQHKRRESRKAEKQPIRQDIRKFEKQPRCQDRARKPKVDGRRRPTLREERPHKRPRNLISHAAPLPPARAMLPSDAYSRDPYYLERRDPHVSRHDPYITRTELSTERPDRYRDVVRDPYLVRGADPNRDGRDPYLDQPDPYIDRRDPYPERRERLDSYIDRRDLYTDERNSYVRRVDPYKDRIPEAYLRDPVAIPENYRRDPIAIPETYRRDPVAISETYRRDPIPERRDVYREERGAAVYRDSYRLEGGFYRVADCQPLGLETSRKYDVASQDPYAAYCALPSNAKPLYSAEYPSRSSLAHVYRL